MTAEFEIEVVYALPSTQALVPLKVAPGTTVEEAIRRSGLLERFPEIDLAVNKVGVFGRLAPLSRPLEAGDRVEIYRPLLADPKEVRRRLAAEGRTMGRKRGAED
ncbi:MAG TPA: RnfH family protein [Gammaproteobacteria bacterium]|nr:RnfH family protein [Gammaproteobacteria bacterium]